MPDPWDVKWQVEGHLGKGGQGITRRVAFRPDPAVKGALKVLRYKDHTQARARMRREVANLQTLASEGGSVPRVLDHNTDSFEQTSVELYVVMDLITGSTLNDYVIGHGPLDVDNAVRVVLSLCKTIEIAHSFPILHRDIKPENIIVRNDDISDLVIIDYGISFNADVPEEGLTETGESFKNKFLALPETNTPSGDHRDLRSDLTALCAILYFCLTKHVIGQLHDGSESPPHLRPGYSIKEIVSKDARLTQIEAILTRGLSPILSNRFQSVQELISQLTPLKELSKEYDESDPLQVAASLTDQIRHTDRKTQLAEFAKHAATLFSYLKKEHRKYSGQLGHFELLQKNGRAKPTVVIPTGLELVARWAYVISLRALHYDEERHRQYLVAARGTQCVLLAGDYSTTAKSLDPQRLTVSTFREVGWYEGKPDSIFQLASIAYREWVTAMMKDLASSILQRNSQS